MMPNGISVIQSSRSETDPLFSSKNVASTNNVLMKHLAKK